MRQARPIDTNPKCDHFSTRCPKHQDLDHADLVVIIAPNAHEVAKAILIDIVIEVLVGKTIDVKKDDARNRVSEVQVGWSPGSQGVQGVRESRER